MCMLYFDSIALEGRQTGRGMKVVGIKIVLIEELGVSGLLRRECFLVGLGVRTMLTDLIEVHQRAAEPGGG